jgi:hypothetical protein
MREGWINNSYNRDDNTFCFHVGVCDMVIRKGEQDTLEAGYM